MILTTSEAATELGLSPFAVRKMVEREELVQHVRGDGMARELVGLARPLVEDDAQRGAGGCLVVHVEELDGVGGLWVVKALAVHARDELGLDVEEHAVRGLGHEEACRPGARGVQEVELWLGQTPRDIVAVQVAGGVLAEVPQGLEGAFSGCRVV